MTGEVEFGLHLMERAKTHLAMNQELRRARPSHRGYFGPEVLLPQNQTPWAAIYGSHSEPAMIAFTNLTCAGFEYLVEEFAKEVPDRVRPPPGVPTTTGTRGRPHTLDYKALLALTLHWYASTASIVDLELEFGAGHSIIGRDGRGCCWHWLGELPCD